MSLEARVDQFEEHNKQMDENLHSLAKTCADIKAIALTNQHEIAGLKLDVSGLKLDVLELKSDVSGLKSDVSNLSVCMKALAKSTYAGFKKVDEQHNAFVEETRERFDHLELLIRQSLPKN